MYSGNVAIIPLGAGGLLTDDPHTSTPISKLFRAKNVILKQGRIEKAPGSHKWNETTLGTGIKAFINWRPDPWTSRVICVGSDGKVYRFLHGFEAASEVKAESSDDPSKVVSSEFYTMVEGGQEESGNDRKLFIFSGATAVQVIEGDGTTRRNIEDPAADWTGTNHPIGGLIHRNRLVAWSDHRIYYSAATDHEDFTTASTQLAINPGEGEKIVQCFAYKGRLFVLKSQTGLYFVDDSNASVSNWTIVKINKDFGGTSPFGVMEIKDDVLVANTEGSLTSVKAADTLGDIQAADLFAALHCETAITDEMLLEGGNLRHTLYHKEGRRAYVTYQSKSGEKKDRFVVIDFKNQPEIVIWDKDAPECLGILPGNFGGNDPAYGASDGYIYQMDQRDRDVDGSGYRGEFQTHHTDFSQGDTTKAELTKQFDYVEFVYIPTGDIDLNYEVFIDGRKVKSGTTNLSGLSTLGVIQTGTGKTASQSPLSRLIPISSGQGRRISVKCYNEGAGENFSIARINIYYKHLETQQMVR